MRGSRVFQKEVLEALKKRFPFKHLVEKQAKFLGRRLSQLSDYSIVSDQQEYSEHVRDAYITKERRKMRDDRLTAAELTQFRGILGAANCLIASTRPDIAAVGAMLQQRVGQACVSDLIEANRLVSLIKDHAQMSVTYHSIPIESGVFLLATDASCANAQNLRSQDHVRRSWPGRREVGQSQPSTMAILQAGAAHAEQVGIGAHESVKRDRRTRLDAVSAGIGMERRL